MRPLPLLVIAGLVSAAPAAAQPFPTRSGEVGVLDVPDAEVLGVTGAALAAELRLDRVAGQPIEGGPLPLSAVGGLTNRIDVGLYMREWGQPDDPRPARVVFGGRAKLQLLMPEAALPGIAVSGGVDRVNGSPIVDARVIASTVPLAGVRLLGFVGGEAKHDALTTARPTYGAALTAAITSGLGAAAEALGGPRGLNLGLGLRWMVRPQLGVTLGANYFPRDDGLRVSVGFAWAVVPPRVRGERPLAPRVEQPEEEAERKTARGDRPRFRLRIAKASLMLLGEPRRLQYGPFTASTAGPAKPVAAAAPAKGVAPSLEELADAQVREQEALAGARERRVRSTSDQLDAREKAALEAAKRLEDRERELAAREAQLDAREQRIAVRSAPTQQQRQLESLEAQLAAQERQLLAQERGLTPAIDAARGRERDSASREEAERQEAARLAASVSSATTRSQQIELRKQALAARNRQLASLEARLVAKGERIDALERQNRAKGERLDAWSRRLDTRSERLDLLEKRGAETRAGPQPKPVEPKPGAAPKDKAVFVMVVKSPTAIVKERSAGAAAPQASTALHPGVAVEKAVAAATVVTFPTPASQLSELDRETVDNIAKLAAKERCELLIWARAKDPSLMAEAQRRADEIKTRAIATGRLDAKQVVTRITTRPGAQGVDVVVSALRETARPVAAAPAAESSAPALLAGESGKRQIREAVQAAQPSIEACVGKHIEQKKLQRAEGSLKLHVSPQGRVTKATTGGGELAGTELEECLGRASGTWSFPAADAEYVVDVPITIMRGGAR